MGMDLLIVIEEKKLNVAIETTLLVNYFLIMLLLIAMKLRPLTHTVRV